LLLTNLIISTRLLQVVITACSKLVDNLIGTSSANRLATRCDIFMCIVVQCIHGTLFDIFNLGFFFSYFKQKTGHEFAAKVFNAQGMRREHYVTTRELNLLQKLKDCTHENIVKVIIIEKEVVLMLYNRLFRLDRRILVSFFSKRERNESMRLISSCPHLNNIHCKNRLVKITNLVEFRLSQSQTQCFTNILLVKKPHNWVILNSFWF
jgi:hypothetical protein